MAEIFGIGVDIADIERVAGMRERRGEHFYKLVFTPRERECCLARPHPDECLAVRFAAKEAVMKALGTGWADGVSFTGIEIVGDGGRPEVRLNGGTAAKAASLGVGKIHLSLSHASRQAVAYAVAEKLSGDASPPPASTHGGI